MQILMGKKGFLEKHPWLIEGNLRILCAGNFNTPSKVEIQLVDVNISEFMVAFVVIHV